MLGRWSSSFVTGRLFLFFLKDFAAVNEVSILIVILERFGLNCDVIRYENRTWSAVFSSFKERKNLVAIAQVGT